jgi:outer membrane protein assembly factor BamA
VLAALLVFLAVAAGPHAAALQPAQETITAIQVHGNTMTDDAEVRRLAGVQVGELFDDHTVETVLQRLRAAKKFERVEVLKRFASIADPAQILLVIVVDEGPVRVEQTGDPDAPVRTVKTGPVRLMFLPIIGVEDGYGVTYGARFTIPDPAGANSRISFPATWGGDKRVAAEFDKTFEHAPLDRVTAGTSLSRRTNPYYDVDDDRFRVWIRGERQLVKTLRAGATIGSQRVDFPSLEGAQVTDTFSHGGADLVFDTRIDPTLPRNAVYARAAWEHIAGVNRTDFDARGYVGLIGQMIGQVRVLRSGSDAPLPPYLKPLLGGMSNLRGFGAGTAAGDTLMATSAELVIPLTSPVSFGRLGVSAFVDAGTAYDHGQRLSEQTWKQGIGGSVWFNAAFFRMNVAVAHGLGASTRAHIGATVGF